MTSSRIRRCRQWRSDRILKLPCSDELSKFAIVVLALAALSPSHCFSFLLAPRILETTPLYGSDAHDDATLDWEIVEEYPKIASNNLVDLLATNDRNGNVKQYCQRLDVSEHNLTVPIALMMLDTDRFPSLSKARKACRQGKILWKEKHLEASESKLAKYTKANVGDRVYLDEGSRSLVRQETGQVLERHRPQGVADSNQIDEAYRIPSLVEPPFRLAVVYEDDFMAVVNKPAGVLVYPEAGKGRNNVLFALPYVLRKPSSESKNVAAIDDEILERPVPVHRLDFATSGLLVVAKTRHASRFLAQQFEFRKAKKLYTAMLYGVPRVKNSNQETSLHNFQPESEQDPLTRIPGSEQETLAELGEDWNLADCFLGDKRATTYWRSLSQHDFQITPEDGSPFNLPVSMVELRPSTGRYHQLRRQMAYLYNTPIVGDPIYAKKYVEKTFSETSIVERYHRGLMLCSNEIIIALPIYNTVNGKSVIDSAKCHRNIPQQGDDQSRQPSRSKIYQDADGTVVLKVSIELPQKFEKLLKLMEKMAL